MFDYNICDQADPDIFYKQCRALETNIPGLKPFKLLEDVDGTLMQRYKHDSGLIIVMNDTEVDSVYIISEFDLLPYFKKQ